MSDIFHFSSRLEEMAELVNKELELLLPENHHEESGDLNKAVRYSALAGGKRIRPVLCLMAAECFGGSQKAALRAGCAFELIHTYSLIHDDLPAMDNDDYRRGRLTSHRVFGEATAILAGDSLLTMAFEWFSTLPQLGLSSDKTVKIISNACIAAGHRGMIGGQMLDILNENRSVDVLSLERTHRQKTGALIIAPIWTGAVIADASMQELDAMVDYAASIGLLFQVVDDILDVEGDAETLGKQTGRDAELGKTTYPGLMGLDGAWEYARQTLQKAHNSLKNINRDTRTFSDMADFIFNRRS